MKNKLTTRQKPCINTSYAQATAQGNSHINSQDDSQGATGVASAPKIDTPKMYKVILLNDDYTPMDFVVLVLRRFFAKTEEQANEIMLDVHKKGAGVAGIYSLEIAEMKVMQVNQFAQLNQNPLKSTLEEAP